MNETKISKEEIYKNIKLNLEEINESMAYNQSAIFSRMNKLKDNLHLLSTSPEFYSSLYNYTHDLEKLYSFLNSGEEVETESKSRNNLLKKLGEIKK